MLKNNNKYPSAWDLKYFQEIAATGNLSRAAERLGVGQPGLSLTLKRLEESLGAELFLRRSRGLVLTAAGTRLLGRCNKLQEEWDLLVSETTRSETQCGGSFRLGCHTAMGIYALNPFVRDVYAEYPGIQFVLAHGLSREMCEGVISGNLDFAFAVNPVRHPDLVIKKLAVDEVCVWGTRDHLEDVLIYDPSLTQSQFLIKRAGRAYKKFVHSSSLELIASLAQAGTGAAILPTRIAESLAPAVKRLPNGEKFRDEITFTYRHDLPKTAATAAILDAVRELKL